MNATEVAHRSKRVSVSTRAEPRLIGSFGPIALWQVAVRRSLGALFALALAASQALAEYRFDVWTTDSGLPHNTVRGVVQSRDGYLWVGTLDGLARFDGVRFTVFNKANSPGLSKQSDHGAPRSF